MNRQQFAALIGFLFIAVWIAHGFGNAVLCLVGAAVFWGALAFYRGELSMADLQSRFPPRSGQSRPLR